VLVVVIGALVTVVPRPAEASLTEWLQASESAIKDLVFLGIGIYFLLSLEVRRKRRRARYLDYSSEMLSLLNKAAALHIPDFDDPVTIATVNDVESLTTGLARKIWQKIMILDRMVGAGEPCPPGDSRVRTGAYRRSVGYRPPGRSSTRCRA